MISTIENWKKLIASWRACGWRPVLEVIPMESVGPIQQNVGEFLAAARTTGYVYTFEQVCTSPHAPFTLDQLAATGEYFGEFTTYNLGDGKTHYAFKELSQATRARLFCEAQ